MKEILTKFAEWLADFLLWLPRKLFELFVDGVEAVYTAIPTPDFITDASGFFAQLSAGIVYFLGVFEFDYLIGAVLTAYIVRWSIRRIPLIG